MHDFFLSGSSQDQIMPDLPGGGPLAVRSPTVCQLVELCV